MACSFHRLLKHPLKNKEGLRVSQRLVENHSTFFRAYFSRLIIDMGQSTTHPQEPEGKKKAFKQQSEGGENRSSKAPSLESRKHTKNRKLPEGWTSCPSAGEPLANLIASKVPLGERFNRYVSPAKRYSCMQVVHQQSAHGRELGMVVDLTNTSKYYQESDWSKDGIKYIKLPCKGRDAVPEIEVVNSFLDEVVRFLCNNNKKAQNKYILVHCTHGYNRTGFMIIHYMVCVQNMTVSKAIQLFAAARPPGIYKPEYIDALFQFYNEEKPESVICPSIPMWKHAEGNSSENPVEGNSYDRGIIIAKKDAQTENLVMTTSDILGDAVPHVNQVDMQRRCMEALGVNSKIVYFPGTQPVSLDRFNLQLLRKHYYRATWKADGTRYMMLITHNGSYLVDRKFNFRRLQLRFPRKSIPNGLFEVFEPHHLTLVDGEMVIETDPETGKKKPAYLVYDLMMLNGHSIIKLPFHQRWKLIEEELLEPRRRDIEISSQYSYEMEPFQIKGNCFWTLSSVKDLLEDFIPKLSHESDGLIFQGWDDPYTPHTHHGLLKWKYTHMISVDFLFQLDDMNNQSLYLFDKNVQRKLDGACVKFKGGDPSRYFGKIIECRWNRGEEAWEFMRIRPDKAHPNGWRTYMEVMRSIADNITQEDILNKISDIIQLPMYSDR